MPDVTSARPDLTTFARLDDLGLIITGRRVEPDGAAIACQVLAVDQ